MYGSIHAEDPEDAAERANAFLNDGIYTVGEVEKVMNDIFL